MPNEETGFAENEFKRLDNGSPIARGKAICEAETEVVSNMDMYAVLAYRKDLLYRAKEADGCCGQLAEHGLCWLGRCPLMTAAKSIVRQQEKLGR